MTSESTAPNTPFDAREIMASIRAGFAMLLKVIMGGLVVIAAGILAVAVAMVGLILASAAVGYRLVSGQQRAPTTHEHGDGIILEAKQTPRGWTVE